MPCTTLQYAFEKSQKTEKAKLLSGKLYNFKKIVKYNP